ncbi:MAG: peptidase, partial [Gemmatimonadales bacterium]
ASGVTDDLRTFASELGLNFQGVETAPAPPAREMLQMRQVRVGLWDQYGGSMPSGWARWILEQFEFPFEVVYPQALDQEKLRDRFDVLVFPSGGIPGIGAGSVRGRSRRPIDPSSIPAEYRDRLGRVSVDTTVPQLQEFLQQGGTIVTIGTSTRLAYHMGLPLSDHKVDDSGQALSREVHFVPGSILKIRVDNTRPVAWGMAEEVDVHFNNSPVFDLGPTAAADGVTRLAWFDTPTPLRSGWAWGQELLENGVTMVEAQVGSGRLYMFGPEIIRRGQPHGTFKFLFNAIYLAGAERPIS